MKKLGRIALVALCALILFFTNAYAMDITEKPRTQYPHFGNFEDCDFASFIDANHFYVLEMKHTHELYNGRRFDALKSHMSEGGSAMRFDITFDSCSLTAATKNEVKDQIISLRPAYRFSLGYHQTQIAYLRLDGTTERIPLSVEVILDLFSFDDWLLKERLFRTLGPISVSGEMTLFPKKWIIGHGSKDEVELELRISPDVIFQEEMRSPGGDEIQRFPLTVY